MPSYRCLVVLGHFQNAFFFWMVSITYSAMRTACLESTAKSRKAWGCLTVKRDSAALFLAHVDSLKSSYSDSSPRNQLLIIGTLTDDTGGSIGCVDKIFSLEPPNDGERREMIASYFKLETECAETSLLLADLVECTVGRSRSELTQYCRQAVASCCTNADIISADNQAGFVSAPSSLQLLTAMKSALQSLKPESLRTGNTSDFMDMTVLTARDLELRATDKSDTDAIQLPLFGHDAELVWKELEALILMPLCQANDLDELLYGLHSGEGKSVCGGVLLSGEPGCGKSALAYHCARVAAKVLPSVTLIDVSCTSLVHKEVGGSERAVRRMFASAKAAAPCILLLDGIENVAAVRGNDNTTEGTMDRILSTLLIELDGVDTHSSQYSGHPHGKIAVIGCTHDERWIDQALRRPGRLEKVLKLHKPDFDARRLIVQRELDVPPSSEACATEVGLDEYNAELSSLVASRTDGMSGAEVIAMCYEARMISAREQFNQKNESPEPPHPYVCLKHFNAAGLAS